MKLYLIVAKAFSTKVPVFKHLVSIDPKHLEAIKEKYHVEVFNFARVQPAGLKSNPDE